MTDQNPRSDALRRLANLLDEFPDLPYLSVTLTSDVRVHVFLGYRNALDFDEQKAFAAKVAQHLHWVDWKPERHAIDVALVGKWGDVEIALVLDPVRRRFDLNPNALLGDLIPKAALS